VCRGRQVRDGGAYGCAVPRAYANLNPGLHWGDSCIILSSYGTGCWQMVQPVPKLHYGIDERDKMNKEQSLYQLALVTHCQMPWKHKMKQMMLTRWVITSCLWVHIITHQMPSEVDNPRQNSQNHQRMLHWCLHTQITSMSQLLADTTVYLHHILSFVFLY